MFLYMYYQNGEVPIKMLGTSWYLRHEHHKLINIARQEYIYVANEQNTRFA